MKSTIDTFQPVKITGVEEVIPVLEETFGKDIQKQTCNHIHLKYLLNGKVTPIPKIFKRVFFNSKQKLLKCVTSHITVSFFYHKA